MLHIKRSNHWASNLQIARASGSWQLLVKTDTIVKLPNVDADFEADLRT